MFVPAKENGQVDFEINDKKSGFDEKLEEMIANCKLWLNEGVVLA